MHTVHAHLAALRSRLSVHNEAQATYVLWLGYRDHIATCSERHHEKCLPDLEQIFVRQAQADED